eukprot:Mrub_01702.p1 GENE.Mrub_01702~~Mrub_01702.p1  ORF type:complete len:645 (-),score=65.52 Mrub_01702:88-1839(-)
MIVCHFLSCFLVKFVYDYFDNNWWLSIKTDDRDSKGYMYLSAWYWAIQTVTTVGYGDIPSVTIQEKFFKLFAMIIGVIVFSDFIGSVTMDFSENESIENAKGKLKIDYVKNKYNLNAKSMLQLEKVLTKSKKYYLREEITILNELPPNYKNEVMIDVRDEFEKRVMFFNDLNQEMFEYIFYRLKYCGYSDTEPIYKHNNKIKGMYWIQTGKIAFKCPYLEKYNIIADGYYKFLNVGENFGLESCLFSLQHINNVISTETCELLFLNRIDLLNFIEKYSVLNKIKSIALNESIFSWRSKYAIYVILNFMYYRIGLSYIDIQQFCIDYNIQDVPLNYHPKSLYVKGMIDINWWHSIIGNYYDKWISQMGNKKAKFYSQRLDFDLARYKRQVRTGRLFEFYNLDALDFKSESVDSDANSYFGDGNKDNFKEEKINVGMIRINKKVKRATDYDTEKKLDENHEIDNDVLGSMSMMKWIRDHRKCSDYFNYKSEVYDDEYSDEELNMSLLHSDSNNVDNKDNDMSNSKNKVYLDLNSLGRRSYFKKASFQDKAGGEIMENVKNRNISKKDIENLVEHIEMINTQDLKI